MKRNELLYASTSLITDIRLGNSMSNLTFSQNFRPFGLLTFTLRLGSFQRRQGMTHGFRIESVNDF